MYTDALDRALQIAETAAETARKGSHYRAESQARGLAGFIKTEMAAFADAREQLNLALALSQKLKARRFEAHYLCDLAKLAEAEANGSEGQSS